jgi:hypothetical protein
MSTKLLNISCRKAAELMCKKEEGAISFWQNFQLSYHLLICSFCRLFHQQDQWLKKNLPKVDNHCQGCLSETEKQNILNRLKETTS